MRSRRGLSSVVGMVFVMIALATTVGYVTHSLDVLEKFSQSLLVRNQQIADLGKENFEVSGVTLDKGKFNITITNTGNLPLNLTAMWVQNTTATDWVNRYTINKLVTPSSSLTNIGQSSALAALASKSYHMKLVSERGTAKEVSVDSVNAHPLFMQLSALPKIVTPGYTTTLLYAVVNNMTGNNLLANIQPNIPQISYTGNSQATLVSGPTPDLYSTLRPGDIVYFKWIYTITGNSGDTVTFTTSLENGIATNIASETVTVQEIAFASQSKTTLQSLGLTGGQIGDDILVLHKETADTPGGAFQMYSGQVDSSGYEIKLENGGLNDAKFFTQNDTLSSIDVPAGNWNIVFRYRSDAMPDLLQSNPPDMIFHFAQNSPTNADSSGHNNVLTISTAPNNPSFSSSCDRDGSGCFTFNGPNQYLSIARSTSYNHIDTAPDSTAGWFKTNSLPSTKGIIYRIEGSGTKYYEVALDSSGKIVFSFNTGSITTTCTSAGSTNYANNKWQHFVAVRHVSNGCKLFINGTQSGSTIDNGGGANDKVDTTSAVLIDKDPNDSPFPYYFTGSVDYIMHWNSYALSAAQAVDLYQKNYGIASHTIGIGLDRTDQSGNVLANLKSATNIALPFQDGKGSTTWWGSYNYTAYLSNTSDPELKFHFLPDQRLRLDVSWMTGHNEALDMHWRVDDNTISDMKTSYIQFPKPNEAFPSFFTYDRTKDLTFTAQNLGPNGLWLIFAGTKAVFQDMHDGTSYAGFVKAANSTSSSQNIDTITDSLFVPNTKVANLLFFTPKTTPTASTSQTGNVVPGHYRLYVNLVGYDDTGSTVFRTFYVGIVRVI